MARLWPLSDEASDGVGRDALRQVMRRWTTGVAVVTLASGGERRGVTVNSFTSVSLEPPVILICLDSRARTHHFAVAAGRFCVNLLNDGQEALSNRFAGRVPGEQDRFDDCSSANAPSGLPILDGALAWADCRLMDSHVIGDHTILFGLVTAASGRDDGAPLLYTAGSYRRLAPVG